MEIAEIKETILVKDQESIKIWCRHHLLDIITSYQESNLSQADFAKSIGMDAKYFYGLINLARKQGLLARSKLGLARMNKKKQKKSKPSVDASDFKEVKVSSTLIAPRRGLIRIQSKNGLYIETEDVAAAIQIIEAIQC